MSARSKLSTENSPVSLRRGMYSSPPRRQPPGVAFDTHLLLKQVKVPVLSPFISSRRLFFFFAGRMALTESFNDGAHGEIHELLGGAWSLEATAYAERTSDVVQPFVHVAVVSSRCCRGRW